MTTKHSAALDHALAEALRHSLATHADSVSFEVMVRDDNGSPLRFRVCAWKKLAHWPAENSDPLKALKLAMAKLRVAMGKEGPR